MPVLLSYAYYSAWLDQYQPAFKRILIDSGAFSALTTGKPIDVQKYAAWVHQWKDHADAIAGVDDIAGDWRLSLRNYQTVPEGFPTIHDIGIGLKPPREGKETFVRWVCDNVPEDLHLHGWALRRYTHVRRLNSVDSTNWWRDAMAIRQDLPWLTYGETLQIVVKRYQRWTRVFKDREPSLYDEVV